MPPLPSRKSLEAMKRVDLQRLCKDYGVRANLKSEALIDLLLDTQSQPPPPPSTHNTRRSVSTRQSSRAGPSRISSIIIHDTDDEADNNLSQHDNHLQPKRSAQAVAAAPLPPVRTRKAKEMQTRLGVGRPVAAGGAGPRAVTKSSSVSRSRRGKPSRSLKQIEATIQEEPEESTSNVAEPQPTHRQSPESHEPKRMQDDTPEIGVLQSKIQTLELEVRKVQHLSSEVEYFRSRLALVGDLQHSMDGLLAEVRELREKASLIPRIQAELKDLKDTWIPPRTPPNPSTPKTEMMLLQPPPSPGGFKDTPGPSNGPLSHIPEVIVAHSPTLNASNIGGRTARNSNAVTGVLGKRHRDSAESTSSGVANEEVSSDADRAESSTRPVNKRPKLSRDDIDASGSLQPELKLDSESTRIHPSTAHPYHFKIFQGPEESNDNFDSHTPTNPLPEFFGAPSPSEDILLESAIPTQAVSRNASENQNQFTFSLLPSTSTPNSSLYMPSFPYPDPPQSPSPAGTRTLPLAPGYADRTDPFKNFGLPSPRRRRPSASSTSQQPRYINPGALIQDVGASAATRGTSLTSGDMTTDLDVTALSHTVREDRVDSHPIRRTMYGTELEGDTRFGDFGVNGVASGFCWTSGKF